MKRAALIALLTLGFLGCSDDLTAPGNGAEQTALVSGLSPAGIGVPPLAPSLADVTDSAGAASAGEAVVVTDKTDYYVGDTVHVSGSGWQAGETVVLEFVRAPAALPAESISTTADGVGDIRSDQFVIQPQDTNATITLTATGQSSGLSAQTTFTDALGPVTALKFTNAPFSVPPNTCIRLILQWVNAQGTVVPFATVATIVFKHNSSSGGFYGVNCSGGQFPGDAGTTVAAGNISRQLFFRSPVEEFVTITAEISSPPGSGVTPAMQVQTFGNPLKATTTTVSVQPTSSTYGNAVTVAATVSATSGTSTPTGTVSFYDGGTCTSPGAALGTSVTLSGGIASVSVATLSAGNHTLLACYAGVTGFLASNGTRGLVVAKAPLTVSADDQSKEYGVANPTFTLRYSGFVLGQTAATVEISGAATFTGTAATATEGADVGEYVITPQKGTLSAANYEFATFTSGKLTVTHAPLTITPNNKTKVYGDPVPELDGTIAGLRNQDQVVAKYVAGSGGLVTATTPVGQYPIAVDEVSAVAGKLTNYAITKNAGTFEVTRTTPAFSALVSPRILVGTSTVTLSGIISAGSGGNVVHPPGNVGITLNGVTQQAAIQADGAFSTTFAVNALPVSSGHAIAYAYGGDANFNQAATGAGTLKVVYDFKGFFQPVDNNGVYNRANAGRAIPIKFSLSGNQGLDILQAGSPSVGRQSCTAGPTDAIEETVTASSSGLTYDATSDQYTYVWKTQSNYANSCQKFVLLTRDGERHEALFQFTK